MSREFDGNQSKWELEKKEENIFKIKNVEEQKYLAIKSSIESEKIEITTTDDITNINQNWILAEINRNKYRICRFEYNNLCLAVKVNSDNSEEIVLTWFKGRNDNAIKQKTWILVKFPSESKIVNLDDETTLKPTLSTKPTITSILLNN
jgi:hypothetical protein